MQELLELLVKTLVKNENEVEVSKEEDEKAITFLLKLQAKTSAELLVKMARWQVALEP